MKHARIWSVFALFLLCIQLVQPAVVALASTQDAVISVEEQTHFADEVVSDSGEEAVSMGDHSLTDTQSLPKPVQQAASLERAAQETMNTLQERGEVSSMSEDRTDQAITDELPGISVAETAVARSATNVSSQVVNSIRLTGGKEVLGAGEKKIRIDVDWSIPNGSSIQPGDTFSIQLPNELRSYAKTIDLNGYGSCAVTSTNLVCTFSAQIEGKENVKGNAWIEADLQHIEGSGETSVPLTFTMDGKVITVDQTVDLGTDTGVGGEPIDRTLSKYGVMDYDDPTLITWQIAINEKKELLADTSVTDTLGEGLVYEGSPTIYKNGQVVEDLANAHPSISWNQSETSFTFSTYISAGESYIITYTTRVTNPALPKWENKVTLSSYSFFIVLFFRSEIAFL